jgi:hypothetical protein
MELPVYAKYCPNCGIQVHRPHVHHEMGVTQGPDAEVRARHLDRLFDPVYHEIEMRLEDPRVDKPELYDTARRIEGEVLKGPQANPQKVERWLHLYQDVAPDLLGLAVTALLKDDAGVPDPVRHVAEQFTAVPAL